MEPFSHRLLSDNLTLERGNTDTIQINVGLLCNQACVHCHLNAGPGRTEVMDTGTMDQVIAYIRSAGFHTVDITGGAPEMVPDLKYLVSELSSLVPRIMLRSNLTALSEPERKDLIDVLRKNHVVIVASFPSVNRSQADAQRGDGIFEKSLQTLKMLNRIGYGMENSGLELNLISNPVGAFLPPSQVQTEKRFKRDMAGKWGIHFNQLFTFANVPLGRFRVWLKKTGNLEPYLNRLAGAFNPCTLEGVMCRTLVSVSWDGFLFDCDFNLAKRLHIGGKKTHVSQMTGKPVKGKPIVTGDHCYACTAGAGFT